MTFQMAIEAGLPLVSVQTRDTYNLLDVLQHLTKKKPVKWTGAQASFDKGMLLYYIVPEDKKVDIDLLKTYTLMANQQATLLLVNWRQKSDLVFDLGELPVPKKMLQELMKAVTENEGLAEKLLPALGGITIKEAAEYARLTMARDKSLTPQGVMKTRKTFFQGTKGVTLVDTVQLYYEPYPELTEWLKREASYFLKSNDVRLRPRGLMFDGPPGTGKTAGAKYLANQMGIPLYRFDLGGMKQKYVGESEQNNLAAMQAIDQEEPCVVLIDEVEKVLGGMGESDAGTTTTMFSQILWWLAERQSRVLVVMTTNQLKKLPPELYREGRVDQVMWFAGLEQGEPSLSFIERIIDTFDLKWDGDKKLQVADQAMKWAIKVNKVNDKAEKLSQAMLTTATYQVLKQLKVGTS